MIDEKKLPHAEPCPDGHKAILFYDRGGGWWARCSDRECVYGLSDLTLDLWNERPMPDELKRIIREAWNE